MVRLTPGPVREREICKVLQSSPLLSMSFPLRIGQQGKEVRPAHEARQRIQNTYFGSTAEDLT